MTSNPSSEVATRDPGPAAPLMERLAAIGVPEKLSSQYIAVDPDSDVVEVIVENLGGDFEDLPLNKLPRMKFPTGGEIMFNVPDSTNANGVRQEKRLTAIMVVSQSRRAFWPTVNLTGNPPECFALDGKNGQGKFGKGSAANPSGKCSKCPMSNFGTKAQLDGAASDAQGQACKQTRLLYLLMPGAALPMQLSVPPASLKIIDEYLLNLAAVGTPTPFYAVEVELSLQRQSSGGNPYAELLVSTVRKLDDDEVAVTRVYSRQLKAMLDAAGADALIDEVNLAEPEGDPEGGISFDGEAATETGGFDDVGTADEEEYTQGAAANGAGKARASAKG